MRHGKHKFKLGVSPSHRKALIKNLAVELIDHGRIRTTLTRSKALKSYVEKLVTLAKEDTVSNRRQAFKKLSNKKAVQTLFTEVAPKMKERKGGYTRVMRFADTRVGDGSKMGLIEFVD